MENLKNRIDVELVKNEKDDLNLTSEPSYMSQKIFDNDLVVIRKSKITWTYNKPAYVGVCKVDLRRVLMYGFHYDYVKNIYFNTSRLWYAETDILVYEIKTEDVY